MQVAKARTKAARARTTVEKVSVQSVATVTTRLLRLTRKPVRLMLYVILSRLRAQYIHLVVCIR